MAGGCCFIKGTKVELADGSPKNIDEIKVGDKVRGVSGSVNKVKSIMTPGLDGRQLWSFNGGAPWVTWEHPFLSVSGEWLAINPDATRDEGWKEAIGKLTDRAVLIHRDGAYRVTHLVGSDEDEQTVYNLQLTGDNTYFANGFAVHNKPGDGIYENNRKTPAQLAAEAQAAAANTALTSQVSDLTNQYQQLINQQTPNGAGGTNPINAPFTPNATGNIGAGGQNVGLHNFDVQNAWIPGVQEAGQVYNLGQPQLDPNGYLDTTMQNLMQMQDPQANPYLDQMLQKGQQSVAEQFLSSAGISGRGAGSFDPASGQINDQALNMLNGVGDFTSDFLGNQYQQDMNRAMQAQLGGGDWISKNLQMQQSQPWKGLQNYANITSQLTGSSPNRQQEEGSSGWDRLIGAGSLYLSGGAFSHSALKEDKRPVDVLEALLEIPVERWKYLDGVADSGEHIGPYAQDFKEAFKVGDGVVINYQDALGVALRSIQELASEVRDLKQQLIPEVA